MKQNKTLLETINYLRGIFMLIFLTVTSSVFSQTNPPPPPPIDINAITTGYHECYIDGVYVDRHTDRSKATTHCASLKANNPDALIGFTYPDFTKIDVTGYKVIEVDTIQVIRVKDLKGWIDNTGEKTIAYLPFYNNGVVEFATDTVYNWQHKYNFKTTKTFGKIAYTNLNIPFQYREVWSDNGAIYVRITEKQVRITSWVDGVKFKEFIPGSSDEYDGGFEYMFGVPSSGEFVLETENEDGEVITYKTTLKL